MATWNAGGQDPWHHACNSLIHSLISVSHTNRDIQCDWPFVVGHITRFTGGERKPVHYVCWPYVTTQNARRRDTGDWPVCDPATEVVKWPCNTQFWLLLGLTGDRRSPIEPDGWSCHVKSSRRMIVLAVIFKLLSRQTSTQSCFILEVQENGSWGSIAPRWQYLKPFKQCANK